MKLLSYNILSGGFNEYKSEATYPEKMDDIVKFVRSSRADFVSLVDTYRWHEIFSEDDLRKLFGFNWVKTISINDTTAGKCGMGVGITILSKLECEFETVRIFNRDCVKSAVKSEGKEIEIFSVYLDNDGVEKRTNQAEEIIKNTNPNKATIICGDLNTIKKSESENIVRMAINLGGLMPWWRRDKKLVNGMRDNLVAEIFEKNGFVDAGGIQKEATIPTKLLISGLLGPFLRLDYFLANKLINIRCFEVLKSKELDKISDHYPIWMEVE